MFKVEVIQAKSNTKQQSRQGQVSKKQEKIVKPVAVTVSQFQCNQVYQTLIPMIKVGMKKGFSIDHN